MTPEFHPSVHTLLFLNDTSAVRFAGAAPDWARDSLARAPWVVVRRAAPIEHWCAAGLRGTRRSERCAIDVPANAISRWVTPEILARAGTWRHHPRALLVPAIGALQTAADVMADCIPAAAWGPTGSVGFELASGQNCATASSDLDLILRADRPICRRSAVRLVRALARQPVRVDVLIETPLGGVALAEWAVRKGPWLLRTSMGPRLVRDPWGPVDDSPS